MLKVVMCARFSLMVSPTQFRMLFGVDPEDLEWKEEFFPTDAVPVLTFDPVREGRSVQLMRWGLIPPWSDDPKSGQRAFNARSETAAEKPSFRGPLQTQRCVLPATCFYEWPRGVRTQIGLPKGEPFGFAGLWETGRFGLTCTMLTCEPNEAMRPIHNRMPVILRRDEFEKWLQPGNVPEPMMMPFDGELEMVAASSGQGSLFD